MICRIKNNICFILKQYYVRLSNIFFIFFQKPGAPHQRIISPLRGSQGAGSISLVIIMSSLRDYDYFTPSGLPESGGGIHRYNNAIPSGLRCTVTEIPSQNNVIPSGLGSVVVVVSGIIIPPLKGLELHE